MNWMAPDPPHTHQHLLVVKHKRACILNTHTRRDDGKPSVNHRLYTVCMVRGVNRGTCVDELLTSSSSVMNDISSNKGVG